MVQRISGTQRAEQREVWVDYILLDGADARNCGKTP